MTRGKGGPVTLQVKPKAIDRITRLSAIARSAAATREDGACVTVAAGAAPFHDQRREGQQHDGVAGDDQRVIGEAFRAEGREGQRHADLHGVAET